MIDYEKMVEDLYIAVLRPGDIAVDCGAHQGRHTVPMARAVGSEGKVFAFEPLGPIFAKLKQALEGHPNVLAENIALGETETVASFVYVPEFPEYSGFKERIYHDQNIARQVIEVKVRRLDEVVTTKNLRYIKIDAEGGDLQILRGATGLIDKARPIITFEMGDNALINFDYGAADFFDFFAQRRYRLFSITGLPMNRAKLIENSAKQTFWDYVACPEELVGILPFKPPARTIWTTLKGLFR
jgi:FkbM family methyltransferase